jgi:hypothetical protein
MNKNNDMIYQNYDLEIDLFYVFIFSIKYVSFSTIFISSISSQDSNQTLPEKLTIKIK